jgi:acyl-coenzyme A thioesterase PaaI-like protein
MDVGPIRAEIISEMGLETNRHGEGMRGEAEVWPEQWVPGTQVLRSSVLLTWSDVVSGLLSSLAISPRVAVTLDLEVHHIRQHVGTGRVEAHAELLKAGRSVVVCEIAFTDGDGRRFAMSQGTFMASPNPEHVHTDGFARQRTEGRRLSVPLAERTGIVRVAPGHVEQPRHEEGLNPIGAIQGGLVALAAEEAAVSITDGTVLTDLRVRYLRPFLAGPAVAMAEVDHGYASVRLTDAGAAGKLGAVATGRLAPAAG